MKVPLKWLADHVDLSDIPLPELVERLTLAGLEVSGVRLFGLPAPAGLKAKEIDPGPVWDRDKVVTAHVLKIDKHPNADKLKLVTLDYGAGEPKTVVTGAPNIAVGQSGMKVILGLRGTRYFTEEEDKATKKSRGLRPWSRRSFAASRTTPCACPTSSSASPTSTRGSSSSTTTPRSARPPRTSSATWSSNSTCCRTWPAACR